MRLVFDLQAQPKSLPGANALGGVNQQVAAIGTNGTGTQNRIGNSSTTADSTLTVAAGTSSLTSSIALRSLSTPLATWYSETMELFARNTNSAAMASREDDPPSFAATDPHDGDDDDGGGGEEDEEEAAPHAAPRRPPSSSMAMRTPRFTSSWWKWGALSSRTHDAASSSSRDRRYSFFCSRR